MIKRFLGSLMILFAIVALGITGVAHAQSTTGFVPEPFVTTIGGLAIVSGGGQGPQYTNALNTCSAGIIDSLPTTPYNIGDGCTPNLVSLYDVTDIATDTYGNVYWSDNGGTGTTSYGTAGAISVSPSVRILYKGGATAANLIYQANIWNTTFTTLYPNAATVQSNGVGKVFTVGGGYSTAVASGKGVACAGKSTYSTSYDTQGDGCPATLARITTVHSMTVDKYGNIYIASGQAGSSSIPMARMIYAGGTQPANLITSVNTTSATGVTAAQPGYIYSIGFLASYTTVGAYGDGGPAQNAGIINPSGIAVDSKGNVYVSDGGAPGSEGAFTGGTYNGDKFYYMNLEPNNVREIFGVTNGYNLVGNVTTVAGETACGGDYIDTVGNHGLLTSASVDSTNAPSYDKAGGNSATNTLTTVNSYYPYVGIGVSLTGTTIPYGCPGSSLAESYTNAAVSTSYVMAYYAPYSNYYDGDGGPATSAYINYPGSLVVDGNDNLYISEPSSNRIRVVYSGTGSLPSAVASSPVAGYIYTYAGVANGGSTGYGVGSAGTVSPVLNTSFPTSNKYTGLPATTALVLATNASITKNGTAVTWDAIGVDPAGNIYSFEPSNRIVWKIDPVTNIATRWLGGGNYNNYAIGSYCNAGTTGPKILDVYGSGCPATTSYTNPAGKIVFDPSGNIWMANPGTNSGGTGTNVIQEYSTYSSNNGTTAAPYSAFPATADGSTTSLYAAFLQTYNPLDVASPSNGVTLNGSTGITFGLQGVSDSEFSLSSTTGANTCANGTSNVTLGVTCALLLNFTPSASTPPGDRNASVKLYGSSTASGSSVNLTSTAPLIGVASTADLAIDTGTTSTIGTGITPAGVATDLNGNVYASDSANNEVWKGATSGTTLTALITGLNNPAQVAVDYAGNIYVANTGANNVIETNSTGTVIATITGSTLMSTTLSAPQGVAIDPYGNLYVADTGNNRVVRVSTEGFIQPLNLMTSGTTALTLSSPTQLAFDTAGDLFILNSGNSTVYEVPISSSGGTSYAFALTLNSGITPKGIAVDAAGDLYVVNSAPVLQLYTPGSSPSTPNAGVAVLSTGLTTPVGLAVDANAQLFIADSGKTGVTADLRSKGNATSFTTSGGTANLTLNNVGNAAMTLSSTTASVGGANPSDFSVVAASSGGCTTSGLAAGGNCLETATFTSAGGGTFTASASFTTNAADAATINLSGTISLTAQSITFTPPTTPVTYGASSVTLVATATSGLTVTFTVDSGSTPGACSITSSTTLNFTGAGNCVIDANQAGNGTYSAATQVQNTVVIQAASQTITFTAPATPVTYGASAVTLSASSTSGLTVALTVDVSSTSGACSVSGTTLTFTGAGNCVIDANQAGNAGYSAATQVQRTVVINQASQTITGFAPPSTYTDGSGTVTLSATGGASGISVVFTKDASSTATCSVSGTTLTISGSGICVIDANQAGNTNYTAASQVQATITVSKATPPAISWSPSATSQSYGTAIGAGVLDATESSPAGSIAYTSDISAGGCGTSITSACIMNAGSYTLTATFTPTDTADYNTQTASISYTVNMATPTVSWSPSVTSQTYGAAIGSGVLDATSAGGSITYTSNVSVGACGTTITSSCVIGVGTYTLTATSAATSNYNQGTSSITYTVSKASPTVSWTPSTTSQSYGAAIGAGVLDASVSSPAGSIAYSSNISVGSCGTSITAACVLNPGTYTLTATFTPTDTTDYNVATATSSYTVSKDVTTTTVTSTSYSITPSTSVTLTATVTSGATGTVSFYDGASLIGSPVALSGTTASVTTTLPLGTDSITAVYSGDSNNATSTSSAVSISVGYLAPTVVLSCNPTSVVPGQATTCTATVSGSGAAPTGTVTFAATSTGQTQGTLGSATVVSGVATYYGLVWNGTDVMTATYSGDANYGSGPSNPVTISNYSSTGKLTFNWPFINWAQPVSYGASTGAWPVTLQNLTGLTVTPTIGIANSNFVITGNTCGTLIQGATCNLNVIFSPTSGGSPTGTKITSALTATTSTPSQDASINVSGIALSSALTFNWPFLNFTPTVAVGATSAPWPVTLTNSSGTPTTVNGLSISDGSFTVSSDTCTGQTLAAFGSCTFNVVFSPLSAEITQGGTNVISGATLTASGNSGAVQGTLTLGGWAATALGFNWPFLTFQGVGQGATGSEPWPVTVTNYSGSTLSGLSYAFTGGTNYQTGAFSIQDANNCFGNTLAAGASCVFNVVPSPQSSQSIGAYSATLVVSGTSGASTLTSYSLNVSGQANVGGLGINWNQDQQAGGSTIDFGPQNTKNVASGPWPITVYNNTGSTQTLTLTPSLSQFTTDVPTLTNVPAGGSAVFNLYFTPTADTTYKGTLTITGTGCTYTFNIWGGANK